MERQHLKQSKDPTGGNRGRHIPSTGNNMDKDRIARENRTYSGQNQFGQSTGEKTYTSSHRCFHSWTCSFLRSQLKSYILKGDFPDHPSQSPQSLTGIYLLCWLCGSSARCDYLNCWFTALQSASSTAPWGPLKQVSHSSGTWLPLPPRHLQEAGSQ